MTQLSEGRPSHQFFSEWGHECPLESGSHLRETQGTRKAAQCEALSAGALAPPGGREGTHTVATATATSQVASWRRKAWSRALKDTVYLNGKEGTGTYEQEDRAGIHRGASGNTEREVSQQIHQVEVPYRRVCVCVCVCVCV